MGAFACLGVTQIGELAVVGEDLPYAVAIFGTSGTEGGDLFAGEGSGSPLPLVFGKECEGGSPDSVGILWGIGYAATRTDVCTDIFHLLAYCVFS